MISYEVYKALHIFGVMVLFCALGGLAIHAWHGRGGAAPSAEATALRKGLTRLHGIALLIVFVAGFGLMARLGMMKGWPLWIYFKLAIWLTLGGAVALVRRKALGGAWILALPVVGAIGAWLAITKPG